VFELTDRALQELVDGLMRRHFILEKSGFGSRVPKYQQRFCNTEFSSLQFTPQECAILCELLLRGPQTPGELRTRASRMAEFSEVGQIEAALEHLAAHQSGACVVRLAREPGRRDSRYAHLFSGEPVEPVAGAADAAADASSDETPPGGVPGVLTRLTALEQQLGELRAEFRSLREKLGES
jgi:hypothetical protein